MKKFIIALFATQIAMSAGAQNLDAAENEVNRNTTNVIRAAWELKRLSESLSPGVDTRCYIAEQAAFNAKHLADAAKVVSRYQNTESDAFAIQSVELALKEFRNNDVKNILAECKEKDS